ncbi:unnamed protein product [Prorocentrum cordatum]|uniref:PX domain-containing protein n=1 Tax=Prorocentrum cordatum TaxID=2364126 RepID=A0ABN9YGQ3_9DINO|nr:unnamed protein product [Polarella glacialis]
MVVKLSIEGTTEDGGVRFYTVLVTNESGRSWTVEKRYSDFLALDERLKQDGALTTADLPPKAQHNALASVSFFDRRRGLLEAYLGHLAKQVLLIAQNRILHEFLEPRFEVPPPPPQASGGEEGGAPGSGGPTQDIEMVEVSNSFEDGDDPSERSAVAGRGPRQEAPERQAGTGADKQAQ